MAVARPEAKWPNQQKHHTTNLHSETEKSPAVKRRIAAVRVESRAVEWADNKQVGSRAEANARLTSEASVEAPAGLIPTERP